VTSRSRQIRADLTCVGGLRGAAWIDPARCQGCGTCTAECPAKAIQLLGYRDEQIMSGVGAWEVRKRWGFPHDKVIMWKVPDNQSWPAAVASPGQQYNHIRKGA